MRRGLLSLVLLSLQSILATSLHAATINANSASRTDVLNAINAASNGDTVVVPIGSATWSSTISVSKGITIQGAGIGNTTITVAANPAFSVSQINTYNLRITGFQFNNVTWSRQAVRVNGSPANAIFRIDHCRFNSPGDMTAITATGGGRGLIDHCFFESSGSPNEMIHNEAYGNGSNTGWAYAVTPGSDDALYVEANHFQFNASGTPAYFLGASAMQNYYGARTVFRYNTNQMTQFDNHGTAGMRGGRWWECYSNRFVTVANANQDKYFAIRAGSGVIFGNHHTGPNSSTAGVVTYEEDSGSYPQQDQVGRGQNQALDPAYIWGNTDDNRGGGAMNVSGDGLIQANRDYYLTSKPGYTPYQYPHPLQNAQPPVTTTNRAPFAVAQSVSANTNTSKLINLVGVDPDGDTLTFTVVTPPAHGTLSGSGQNLTYTPNAGYQGPDSFTFKVNDGELDSNVATVSITVSAIPPVPGNAFHVDQDHPNAADTASGGTENQPWRTIGYALSRISGGDTILIKESTSAYSVGAGMYIYGPSGTAQRPTTVKAYPGHTPQIRGTGNDGRIALDGVSYWVIEGLDISNFNHLLTVRNGSSFVTVRNNILHDSGGQIVHVYGGAHDIVFENNTLLRGGSIGDENGEAFYIGSHGGGDLVYNITIRSNYINDMEHEGIELKHDTHDCVIEYNTLTNCVANWDFGKWSILVFPTVNYGSNPNHIIRGNIIQSVAATGTGAGIALKTGCYAYNNIVYNVASPAYAIEIEGGDSYTRYLWHNTLDVPASRAVNRISGTASIGNNIGPNTTGNLSFNNSYFVNAASRNYRLVAGSAPINAGSAVPFTMTADFGGVLRSQPFDVGAFEFVGAAPPSPPSGLRIVSQ